MLRSTPMTRLHAVLRPLLLLTLVILSSACSTLATYEINEAELEQKLQDAVKRFDEQQAKRGSPLSLAINEVDIQIGPDNREVVVLAAKTTATVNAVLTKIPVNIDLTLEGAPQYSGKDKAIYLRQLNVVDSRVDSPLFKGEIKPITEGLTTALSRWLDSTPVYRLDENDPKQRLIGLLPVDIVVGQGALKMVPSR